jgi:Domain of unknown function (DUF4232)
MNLIGRPLTAALAVTGAAILVPSVALASTSHSAAARQTAAAACVNAHPALPGGAFVWAALPGDGFAGGVGYIVEITNEGRSACTVRGVPGAALQDNDGHLAGGEIPASVSGSGKLITLQPGATAYFSLIIHDAGALCAHPVSGQVVIYLPGQKQAQDSQLTAQGCAGLPGGGVLSPGTIKAGTGIPLYND